MRGAVHIAIGAVCLLAACRRSAPVVEPLCSVTQPPVAIPFHETSMQPLCDDVYAEPGLDPAQLEELKRDYRTAVKSIARRFGEMRARPYVLFCKSPACKEAFGADPQSALAHDLGFARDRVPTPTGGIEHSMVVISAPYERTVPLLTHEFVHAEMKTYAPYDSTPTWFNEGMATWIAEEPTCDAYPPSSVFDVTELGTTAAWQAHIRTPGTTRPTYCQSRHVVAAWAESFPDERTAAEALKKVLRRVAEGGTFELSR